MEELIRYNDQYYILATSSAADEQTRVLKHGETFAVLDRKGDVRPIGLGEQGLYHEGTRYISACQLRLAGTKPLLLSSTVKRDNAFLHVDLTNPAFSGQEHTAIPHGCLHLARSVFLWQAVFHQRLRIRNYGHSAVKVPLSIEIEADFADIFEVRGSSRTRRGELRTPKRDPSTLRLQYEGLDRVVRQLRIDITPEPAEMSPNALKFDMTLEPSQEETIYIMAHCSSWPADSKPARVVSCAYDEALVCAAQVQQTARNQYCEVYTSNERFNDWLNRSQSDLLMMVTETESGPYPDAGVPWFSTRFGRDGIITALETLWVNPELAAGVLRYLAARQATTVDPVRDSEPGKILHETRKGEMAALGEIPFGLYYGSVDSTPLFVMLAAAYYERTGDLDLVNTLWPNIERALTWLDRYGDVDRDGFVEYNRMSPHGLVQQGWKDSWDGVFHADGSLPEGPIALCEVQGYTYAAKLAGAQLLRALEKNEAAQELDRQAHLLREQFEMAFWCEDLSTYALALDGHKRPCRVRTSNAGHALMTGIASWEHARRVGETLLEKDSFSGWGVRTVAVGERAYNPMSYHNGSIWPHDNALIASGLGRYGLRHGLMQIFAGLFEVTSFVEFHRLPELFCGFPRRPGEGPTLYPVACSPQSWAAATVFSLLQSVLGLRINALQGQIHFIHSRLPDFLKEVEIRGLRVRNATVDLSLRRDPEGGAAFSVRKSGPVEVITTR